MATERRREMTPGTDGGEAVNDSGVTAGCCCWCSCCRSHEMRENWREVDLHGLRRMLPKKTSINHRMSAVRRSVWLVLMLISLVAFVCASTECLFIYLTQHQFTEGQTDDHSPHRPTPAVTLCNLNPLRLTELARRKWPTEARDVSPSGHTDTSAWNDVNASSFDVFTSAGHRLEKLVIRCNAGSGYPCSRRNFTEVITEKGLCYTIATSATTLYLVLNAEAYEYTGLGQEGVGVRVLFHGAEEHPVPTSSFSGLMLAPGLRASINVHRKDVTFISTGESPCSGDLHRQEMPHCLSSCIGRELEHRCSCRPFWSLTKVNNRHATWCSMKQHSSCVTMKISELLERQSSHCSCPICHSKEFLWDYTFSHLVPGPTSTDRGRRYHGEVIPEARLSEIANDRCTAANIVARTCREISRRDSEQITELGNALVDLSERMMLLQNNFQKVELAMNTSLDDLRYRIGFHTSVGLRGLRKSFVSGFADRFYLVRERSLTPLVDGNYETISQLERTVKQLTFTSTTETIARKVLYFMTDNQLSGKLETAIQALDNLTKVYYSFLNTEPTTTQPITPDGRYDLHLLPFGLLSKTQNTMKIYYTGISENIAGLIENILSLKTILKDVYQSNIANETLFDQSRKTFIQRTLHIKHFTSLFQQQIVQNCIDRIDSRIIDLEKINGTLNLESLRIKLSIDSQLSIISTTYSEAYNNVLAFSRLAQQFLRDEEVLKSSLTNSNTDIFIQTPALTSLTDSLKSIRSEADGLRQHWMTLEKAVKAVWKRFIREDLLSNFYLNLYNDVTDMVNNPKRAEQFQELFFRSSTFNLATLHPMTSRRPQSDYVPNDFYTLLNADVSVTNIDVKTTTVADEFHGYLDQTDPQEVIGSARVERLVKAFVELKNNLEELQKQCSISQQLFRENVIVAEIAFPSDDSQKRPMVNRFYSLTSLLANIGGLLALCLGASVITCFELIDVTLQSICRSIGNRKSKKFADTSNHVFFRPVDSLDDGMATTTLRPPHVAKFPLPATIPKVKLDATYRGKHVQHQTETDI